MPEPFHATAASDRADSDLPANQAHFPLLPEIADPFGQFLIAGAPADGQTKSSFPHFSNMPEAWTRCPSRAAQRSHLAELTLTLPPRQMTLTGSP